MPFPKFLDENMKKAGASQGQSASELISKRIAELLVLRCFFSDCRDRSSVDDVLGAVDRGGALRDEKCDQLGDLLGAVGAADGDPAQRVYQPLARGGFIDASLLGE